MLQTIIIPVTAYQQNCSLLWCDQSQSAALIDPGGDIPKLIEAIEQRQLKLEQIWLTHGHLDHVGGTHALAQQFNIPIIGPHKADAFWLEALTQQCAMFNFPPVETFIPDQWLNDGDQLTLGNENFTVIHTPGHTPGHICIAHNKTKQLWVGDVLFKRSIGRTDFPQGDHELLLKSIKEKLFTLPDDYQFVPGHGECSTLSDEQQHNPYFR